MTMAKWGRRKRETGSSDGDQKQALNINAACLREFKAAVHQKQGTLETERRSTTTDWSLRDRFLSASNSYTTMFYQMNRNNSFPWQIFQICLIYKYAYLNTRLTFFCKPKFSYLLLAPHKNRFDMFPIWISSFKMPILHESKPHILLADKS